MFPLKTWAVEALGFRVNNVFANGWFLSNTWMGICGCLSYAKHVHPVRRWHLLWCQRRLDADRVFLPTKHPECRSRHLSFVTWDTLVCCCPFVLFVKCICLFWVSIPAKWIGKCSLLFYVLELYRDCRELVLILLKPPKSKNSFFEDFLNYNEKSWLFPIWGLLNFLILWFYVSCQICKVFSC
jgi:hypothetical protein